MPATTTKTTKPKTTQAERVRQCLLVLGKHGKHVQVSELARATKLSTNKVSVYLGLEQIRGNAVPIGRGVWQITPSLADYKPHNTGRPATVSSSLTDKQRELFGVVWAHLLEHGYQPSVRDLCLRFGMGLNGVNGHLRALARKGFIQLRDDRQAARALRLLKTPDGKPFVGLVPKEVA